VARVSLEGGINMAIVYEVEADYGYGHGWEVVTREETIQEARERLREYVENEGGTYRIMKRSTNHPSYKEE
jgi:hypothetical protein